MQRKKILWLVSWYPNKNDAFDGDFIQRHARAAAIFHDIHVIFVTEKIMDEAGEEEWNYATGLTEQLLYFKRPAGLLGRVKKQLKWRENYRKAIESYIEKNGLPDLVHVHVPWKAGLMALWMKRRYQAPFILTEHWGVYNHDVRDNYFTWSRVKQNLLRNIYSNAESVSAVSRSLATQIEETVGRKCGQLVPNVVDTTLFHESREKYSKFTFIHVSNMVYWKRVEDIMEAFAWLYHEKRGEVQLILIGNRNDQIMKRADSMGLLNKGIFFRGEISYGSVAEEIRMSHCHVLFGNFETFSCVTAESLCSGVPVIVPDAGAAREMVHENNGLIVEKENVGQLAAGMAQIMEQYDRFDSRQIAIESAGKFSYSAIADRFVELYARD